jgi:ATP-dependent exoDNAse (exonuclease V) alpha subunit
VPTSAITVHKVQGQSMDHVIVTKWRDPKMVSQYPMTAYVTLSRVRTLAGLYITQPLTKADVVHDAAAAAGT